MKRSVNLARLSPRRAYAVGLMRARRQARRELRAMAQAYDDELLALRDQLDQIAVAHFEQTRDAAITEALLQRALDPNMLIHLAPWASTP